MSLNQIKCPLHVSNCIIIVVSLLSNAIFLWDNLPYTPVKAYEFSALFSNLRTTNTDASAISTFSRAWLHCSTKRPTVVFRTLPFTLLRSKTKHVSALFPVWKALPLLTNISLIREAICRAVEKEISWFDITSN